MVAGKCYPDRRRKHAGTANWKSPHKYRGKSGYGAVRKSIADGDAVMLSMPEIPVYLACGNTDMRKSINGLSAIVENSFKLDPFGKALFVFCNRKRDRLKILTWEENGFWMYFKRLERGHFKWPQEGDNATMTLSTEELRSLIQSLGIEQKLQGKQVLKKC